MGFFRIVDDDQPIIEKMNLADKGIHQCTSVVDVVRVAIGKTLEEEFDGGVIELRTLYLFLCKLKLQVGLFGLPLFNLRGDDVCRLAGFQSFYKIRGSCLIFMDKLG